MKRHDLLVLPRNSPIIVTNSQYNMAIYFNLYIHTIAYDRDYYIVYRLYHTMKNLNLFKVGMAKEKE